MKELVVLNYYDMILCALGLVVLGYGIRLLQEAVREYLGTPGTSHQPDYIDWSKVPEGYDWVAVEEMPRSGIHVFAYRREPVLRMGNVYASFQGGQDFINADRAIIGPIPPWRESLRRRPGVVK